MVKLNKLILEFIRVSTAFVFWLNSVMVIRVCVYRIIFHDLKITVQFIVANLDADIMIHKIMSYLKQRDPELKKNAVLFVYKSSDIYRMLAGIIRESFGRYGLILIIKKLNLTMTVDTMISKLQ